MFGDSERLPASYAIRVPATRVNDIVKMTKVVQISGAKVE